MVIFWIFGVVLVFLAGLCTSTEVMIFKLGAVLIIRKCGVELQRLVESDIEFVRQMRNRPEIRARMHAQDFISAEQQRRWFSSINNARNYYFVIVSQGKKVGLTHGKHLNFDVDSFESGIYIWDSSVAESGLAAKAALILLVFAFGYMEMRTAQAKVRRDNIRAWYFNRAQGYELDLARGDEYMRLTRERFFQNLSRLSRVVFGHGEVPDISLADIEIPDVYQKPALYEGLPGSVYERLRPLLTFESS